MWKNEVKSITFVVPVYRIESRENLLQHLSGLLVICLTVAFGITVNSELLTVGVVVDPATTWTCDCQLLSISILQTAFVISYIIVILVLLKVYFCCHLHLLQLFLHKLFKYFSMEFTRVGSSNHCIWFLLVFVGGNVDSDILIHSWLPFGMSRLNALVD